MNFKAALDYDDEYLREWSEIHTGAAARRFLLNDKDFNVGAEPAWQELCYACYRVPYGPSPV